MKTLFVLVALSAFAFAGTPSENASALNLTLEDYSFSMAVAGTLGGSFLSFVLWKLIP